MISGVRFVWFFTAFVRKTCFQLQSLDKLCNQILIEYWPILVSLNGWAVQLWFIYVYIKLKNLLNTLSDSDHTLWWCHKFGWNQRYLDQQLSVNRVKCIVIDDSVKKCSFRFKYQYRTEAEIILRFFHYSKDILVMIKVTANHRPYLKNWPMRSLEPPNQLFALTFQVNCWFNQSIESIIQANLTLLMTTRFHLINGCR